MPSSRTERALYARLELTPDATSEAITRAYRRLALKYHPDRNPDGIEQFKALSNAYFILSDPVKKGLYDATGFADASEDASQTMKERSDEMRDQLRGFFAVYAGSSEEEGDIIKAFTSAHGDFAAMIRKYLIFDNGIPTEVRRLHDVTCDLLQKGKLSPTKAWNESTTPKAIKKIERRMQNERVEAEKTLKEMNLEPDGSEANNKSGELSLQALIKQRQKASWETMLNNMEAKYTTNGNEGSKNPRKSSNKRPRESLH
ncbi:unnamed protein product [Phytomonas sp. Hart1]|nr:unnamed protein product [Phytomonas sp. Hart1]|eukprot:CCW69877.1 unnamed protein product [Phytomonas sp. isolate Hart1]